MATTQDIHAPTLGTQGEPCASCGAPLAGDQRYCLECGARRAQARVAFRDILAPGGAPPTPPAGLPASTPDGPPARSGLAFLAGLLCLLAALGVGVLIGNSGGDTTAATPPPAQVITVGGAAAAPAATAPATTSTPAASPSSPGRERRVGQVEQGLRLLGQELEGLGRRQQEGQGPQLELGRGLPEEVPEAPQAGRDVGQGAAQGQQARRRRDRLPGHRMSALTDRFRDRRRAAPAGAPSPPAPPAAHAELRARRDALAEEVAELTWDLGGLTYEMAIRDHFRLDVLIRRAAALQERDAELGEVERLLAAADEGVGGDCRSCGAPTAAAPSTAGSAASR